MDEFTALPIDEPGGELFAAMAFLAALAYPESTTYRDRAIEAMKAMMLRAARAHGSDFGKPSMLMQQQHGTLRRLDGRIEKRLDAAQAAAFFMLGAHARGSRELKLDAANVKRTRDWLMRHGHTMASADKHAAKYRSIPGPLLSVNRWALRTGRGDWERDTWRPSRPVLHLALALRVVQMQWTDPRPFGLWPLLANPQWIRAALASAENHVVHLEYAARRRPALAGIAGAKRVRLLPG